MATKTFDEWWDDTDDDFGDAKDFASSCWNAAWSAAEEKFNSSLRQPTNQVREPAEIISLCIGCVKEDCSQRSELKCCPVTICAMRQAK